MEKENKIILGRLLLVVGLIVSLFMTFTFWDAIKYDKATIIFWLPVGLYLPACFLILLFLSFFEE